MSYNNTVSVKSAIKEYLRRSGHENDFKKQDLKAFANDAADRITTDEQLQPKIAIITINDYKGRLPEEFKILIQAAYKQGKTNDKLVRRGRVAEWSQNVLGSDCELITTVKCPNCSQEQCNCSTPIISFTPDELWKTSNPGFFNAYQKHFVREEKTHDDNTKDRSIHAGFKLMNHATNSFFNVPYHVNNCTNFNVNSKIEYSIIEGNIVTNFRNGFVLLSYFGKPLDEEGYLLIPDNPISMRAVVFTMMEATALIKYNQTGLQRFRTMWMDMLQLSEKYIAMAYSENGMPSQDEFDVFISKFWHQYIPKWNARNTAYEGKGTSKYPKQTYNHEGYDQSANDFNYGE